MQSQIQHALAHKGRADCLRFASPAEATMRLGGFEAWRLGGFEAWRLLNFFFESQTVNVLKRMLDWVKRVIWEQFGTIWR